MNPFAIRKTKFSIKVFDKLFLKSLREFESRALNVLTEYNYILLSKMYCNILVKRFKGFKECCFICGRCPHPQTFLKKSLTKNFYAKLRFAELKFFYYKIIFVSKNDSFCNKVLCFFLSRKKWEFEGETLKVLVILGGTLCDV